MSALIDQLDAPGRQAPAPLSRRHPRRVIDAGVALVGLGLGACVGLALETETASALRAPGGVATFLGQLFGLTGAYLMLVMLLLVARVPWIEQAAGQDRLVSWHRRLGQWPVYLIVLHAVLVTIGYAQSDRIGTLSQFDVFIQSYPDVLASTVALGLIVVAASMSIRAVRRRIRYESWWTIHLYTYLALALAFAHQLANGVSFVGHPLTRLLWAVAWALTAGVVLVFRVLTPLARTARHGLRVVGVQEEVPGVVSIVCSGRRLDQLRVEGGQFFHWRFLTRSLWSQAHPYSLSALPHGGLLRLTVKDLGDHSAGLRDIPVGTRVAIEGPYGAFTRHARTGNRVLLLGAGVGVTPIRAVLEHLDSSVDVTVVLRFSSESEQLFAREFQSLVEQRGGRLLVLIGSRRKYPLDRRQMAKLVHDVAERDTFVCGPPALTETVTTALRQLGVADERIHREEFAL